MYIAHDDGETRIGQLARGLCFTLLHRQVSCQAAWQQLGVTALWQELHKFVDTGASQVARSNTPKAKRVC